MNDLILALGILILLLPLSRLAWISLQNLLQARALRRLARIPAAAPDERGRQAFFGPVRVTRALSKGFGDMLWCRTEHQVYRSRTNDSGWTTVSTLHEWADFTIEAHGSEIRLVDAPTEVHGTEVHSEQPDSARRTVYTYLPVLPFVAAVGRLAGAGKLGKDNKLGLLLSRHEPALAASVETWYGIAGLALVTGAIILGLVIYSKYR